MKPTDVGLVCIPKPVQQVRFPDLEIARLPNSSLREAAPRRRYFALGEATGVRIPFARFRDIFTLIEMHQLEAAHVRHISTVEDVCYPK
ncbi:hypothetical protein [Nostoc sp.]|uniref:hypothetical protein n=1 Tax=Nostoc sp. TaxID=1180 RepID=UPI002FFBF718